MNATALATAPQTETPKRTNDKTYWLLCLEGKRPETHPDYPHYGYYRVKHRNKMGWDPIAYWFEDGALCCVRAGREVRLDDACQMWPYASEGAITEELYTAVVNGAPWPDMPQTMSNRPPDDNSFESIMASIEDLEREAKALIAKGAAKTEDDCNQAANVANLLTAAWKRADSARETEKAPHLKASRDVDDKWRPALTAAKIYDRLKALVVTPFLQEKERKRRAEAAEAQRKADELAEAARKAAEDAARTGTNAEEAERQITAAAAAKQAADDIARRPATAGTIGKRSVGLRTVKVITIEDRDAVIAFFKDHADMTTLLQTLAERTVRTGMAVPGTKVTEEQKAV